MVQDIWRQNILQFLANPSGSYGLYRTYYLTLMSKVGNEFIEIDSEWRREIILDYSISEKVLFNSNVIELQNNGQSFTVNAYGILDWAGNYYDDVNTLYIIERNFEFKNGYTITILTGKLKIGIL